MPTTPLYFVLPENLTAEKFLKKLSKKVNFYIDVQQHAIKTYYDSFDWRLYNADMVCELNQSKTSSQITLIDRVTGECLALEELQDVPPFSAQFRNGCFKTRLAERIEMRALLPLCALPHQVYRLNILNKDQKTVLRITLDEYEILANRISLHPLKGYDKAAANISHLLANDLELSPTNGTAALNAALQLQGRKPKDYSSKLAIKLDPAMRADKASIIIYKQLLAAIQINEAGTIADIDTEFLHDYRVAVRRTRAGLSQIKNTLPPKIVAKHANFFAWLGQITSTTRDLDVYLLSYQQYQAALPETLQADLAPLYEFLKKKQVIAQKELADILSGSKYRKQLLAWEQYLRDPAAVKAKGSNANVPIKELADQRIWKVFQRVLKEGSAISESSPAETLHDLRKTCKKLRYLMEFFQDMYPAKDMKVLLRALKGLQSVLGDFQDYEIQENNIKHFSAEMMEDNIASDTLLAMGVLIQYLDTMKCTARNDFAEQFSRFKQAQNQAQFKTLFNR